MNDTKRFHAIPGMRLETIKLIDALKEGKEGDTFTDEELTELCGKSTAVGKPAYNYLRSAMRHCITHHGIVWQRIREAGKIKCLGPTEVINASKTELRRAHRAAHRSLAKLRTVRNEALTEAERRELNVITAQHSGIMMFAKGTMTKELREQPAVKPPRLPDLLNAMKRIAKD